MLRPASLVCDILRTWRRPSWVINLSACAASPDFLIATDIHLRSAGSSGAAERFLFVPNDADASAQVLAEALGLNVPLLMNRATLGGWHYLNRRTGVTFEVTATWPSPP
jgi:hypothetical protein